MYELCLSYPNNPPVGYADSPLYTKGPILRSTNIITRSFRFISSFREKRQLPGTTGAIVFSRGIPYLEQVIILIINLNNKSKLLNNPNPARYLAYFLTTFSISS